MHLNRFTRLGVRLTLGYLLLTVIAADDGNGSKLPGFRCLLSGSTKTNCDLKEKFVPDRLLAIFNNLSSNSRAMLGARNAQGLSFDDVVDLPPALVYLLPASFLEAASGRGLAGLVQRHSKESPLATKVVGALVDTTQRIQFFDELIGTQLPAETQLALGRAMVTWWPNMASDWTYDVIKQLQRTGSPVLAFLATGTANELGDKRAEKFLYHLRSWHKTSLLKWTDNPKVVLRAWAQLACKQLYTEKKQADLQGYEFLLSAATANEFDELAAKKIDVKSIIDSKFDKLQARALFRLLYGSSPLSMTELKETLPIALQLSPRELQQFSADPNATNFRKLWSVTPDRRSGSLATDMQILELLKAQSALSHEVAAEDDTAWHVELRDLGRFAYVMTSGDLRNASGSGLRVHTQQSLDSVQLSREQALSLTNDGMAINLQKPMSVMGLRGLLKALPTGRLIRHRVGDIPQNVLVYLATSLPSFEPALSAAVLHKLRPQLEDTKTMEYLLSNENPEQFFELMSSNEVASLSKDMLASFTILRAEGFAPSIKKLPVNVLSTLLESSKPEAGYWKAADLKEHVAFLGLSCCVMDAVDVVDVIDVLARYHRELKDAGKAFPKALQYCGQRMVMRYIAMKTYFRKEAGQSVGSLSVLDPAEIQAIGGFILASFPPQIIEVATHRKEILQTIGQLSQPQLLEATGRKDYLSKYVQYLLPDMFGTKTTLGIDELLSVGSFVNFIPQVDKIVDPAAFKFYVEALDDPRSKTLCTNFETRKKWYTLIERSFGAPDTWTAGDLGSLADLLLAVPTVALDSVPTTTWVEAIDSLVEQTSYHLNVLWPGWDHPVPFVQVCSEMLTLAEEEEYRIAVYNLLRRYLVASQAQLETIQSAQTLIDSVRPQQEVIRVVSDVRIERPTATVGVLVPIDEQPPTTRPTPPKETASVKATTTKEATTVMEETMEASSPGAGTIKMTEMNSSRTEATTSGTEITSERTTQEMDGSDVSTATPTVTPEVVTSQRDIVETNMDEATGRQGVVDDEALLDDTESERLTVSTPSPTSSLTAEDESSQRSEDVSTNGSKLFVRVEKRLREKREVELEKGEEVEIYVDKIAQPKLDKKLVKGHEKSTVKIDIDNRTLKKLSCDAVRAVGASATLALQWEDLKLMSLAELENCLEFIGSLEMSQAMSMKIWQRVDRKAIMSRLPSLGRLTQAMELGDVEGLDLNLTSTHAVDTLSVLGRHVRHFRLLEALSQRVEQQNPSASNIGPAALAALGSVVCNVPVFALRRMAGRDLALAAPTLASALVDCPAACLGKLASLVTEPEVFGVPSNWSALDLASLGKIPAGLLAQQWASVIPSEMTGLQPSAMRCIAPLVLKEFSTSQLASLSPLTASVVSADQLSRLSPEQKKALMQVRHMDPVPVVLEYSSGVLEISESPASSSATAAVRRDFWRRRPDAVPLVALYVTVTHWLAVAIRLTI